MVPQIFECVKLILCIFLLLNSLRYGNSVNINPCEYLRSRLASDLGQRFLGLNIFKSFFLETTRLIKIIFLMKPILDGRIKLYLKGPGQMTKMASLPIYGKNRKNLFL